MSYPFDNEQEQADWLDEQASIAEDFRLAEYDALDEQETDGFF
jgi:hypothetical protein